MTDYPMKLGPVYKDTLWGGYRLSENYKLQRTRAAEAWLFATRPNGINLIRNGEMKGQLIASYPAVGWRCPILVKLIDAGDCLSIQVHPDKTEMWVVLECDPGSTLFYGLKGEYEEKSFREALGNGTVESLLNKVPVHPGDVFFVPPGLVHSIGKGILVAEIQQNSDETYRLYDYGRLYHGKPRYLKVEAGLEVLKNFSAEEIDALRFERGRGDENTLANCSHFRVDRLKVDGTAVISAGDPFSSVICIDGSGTIGGEVIEWGNSYLLPHGCGDVVLEGKLEVLITTR